ncbi:hypothetical protein [Methyloversatilis sp. RAC08]|uniref:hypothetical protein n=1 Tax=Methyloversatilis sp. RAC08 TaxID=1842540 RepID=UPI0009F2C709|nr:hypothetical protein [Methyloversatilis sp. RAC08]
MAAVEATLKLLDAWYNEPTQGGDRPKLLSKLSVLELCGWLEGEFDRLALVVDEISLGASDWVKQNILDSTNGFLYDQHWRKMLVQIVGECFARRIEIEMEDRYPGSLSQMKSLLGGLWKIRCEYAHADMTANAISMKSFSAPSWSTNQYRLLRKLLGQYEAVLRDVLSDI